MLRLPDAARWASTRAMSNLRSVSRFRPSPLGRHIPRQRLVETLYRALADNSVGKVIEALLRNDLIICDELGFAPLDDTGAQLLFRFVAAAYERRSLGIGSHWPFESWGRFLARAHHRRQHARPVLHHCHVIIMKGTQTVFS
jgi:DNA replication protein DnaC